MDAENKAGPFCGVCGAAADRLILITPNCVYEGLGKMVCTGCCSVCDLHWGCMAYNYLIKFA